MKITFNSVNELARALRRAKAAHAEYEEHEGIEDDNWPEWYAGYIASAHRSEASCPITNS